MCYLLQESANALSLINGGESPQREVQCIQQLMIEVQLWLIVSL